RIEKDLGRDRRNLKGPRKIDIDILLCGGRILQMRNLTIPHRRMGERRFVLIPLREVADGLRHPVTGRTVPEMLALTPDESPVVWHCR
ncbi:MAG: 2-amino-4-hydroxy-6-hydroxymethyldihydropteridine diphosphokinase, partial [Acidobacteria bacterium]|nr:2-amino-4-hydroxy-6-hydroxymethyldihydropteridine diphosphokinase [Acidobacteriota bacterium]